MPIKSLALHATTRAHWRSSAANKTGGGDSKKKRNPVRKTLSFRYQKTIPKHQKARFGIPVLLGQAEKPNYFLYLGVGSTATSRQARRRRLRAEARHDHHSITRHPPESASCIRAIRAGSSGL